jgi:photosystem II stability/assembly factor-like uncharacterized protein
LLRETVVRLPSLRHFIVVLGLLSALILAGCSSLPPAAHRTTAASTSAPTTSTPSPSPSTHPTTSVPPASTTPTSGPTSPNGMLTSIAFFNPQMGYGMFTRQSAEDCQDLVGPTTDGGSTFGALILVTSWSCGNEASVRSLAFDDYGDGFLYGPDLFVTHNAGRTWVESAQPGAVLSVETLGLSVWMVEAGCPTSSVPQTCALQLLESEDGGRSWSLSPSAPPNSVVSTDVGTGGQTWMVRTSQSSAYLLQNAVRNPQAQANVAPLWLTTDGGTSWAERSIPCAVGAASSIALSAAPDGTLLAVCAGEPGAGNQAKSALRSIDGGVSWTVQSSCIIASSTWTPGSSCATLTFGYLGGIDAVSPDTVFLYGGRSSLLISHDGGALWQAVQPLIGDTSGGTQQAIFFNASDGVVLGEGGDTNGVVTLWRTDDGGTQWTAVVPETN